MLSTRPVNATGRQRRIFWILVTLAILVPIFIPSGRARADAPPNYLGSLPAGTLTSEIPTLSDPTETWELYLPKGYTATRRWPVLLLFDPRSRGRLAAELFRSAADEFGWILASSDNTMSDGPSEPNGRALKAMIPDVMKRLPVDERRIYAGGFSGGAVLAWTVGLKGTFLAGVISISGRPAPEHLALTPKFALFAAAGTEDFNFQATRELDRIAIQAGAPHRLETFPGPHSWCPPEMARNAVRWLQLLAMQTGIAPPDPTLIETAFRDELAAADAFEQSGNSLAAGRKLAEVAATFHGLGDPAAIRAAEVRSARLLAEPAAKSSVKEEVAAEKYELLAFRRIDEAVRLVRDSEVPVPAGELRHTLALDDALRRRAGGGLGGAAAGRALAMMDVHLTFYLMRDLFAANRFRDAIPGLKLMTEVFPEDARSLYNLACAEARGGSTADALIALSRALDQGLDSPAQLETDADLSALRDKPGFADLVARARALNGAPRAAAPAASSPTPP
ncbi:MAG: hypothetical protein ABI639_15040 [Thermoanaerobaculia bacterium]